MQVREAVILAAGLGTRLNPITCTRPKHLLPVAGKPLLEWQLAFLRKCGIERVLVITHYLREVVERTVKEAAARLGLEACFRRQPRLRGTGDALLTAEGWPEGPFLLVYGDVTFTPEVLRRLLDEVRDGEHAILASTVPDPWNYGVLKVNSRGYLVDVVEKPPKGKEPSNLVNAGVYLFSDDTIFDFAKQIKPSPRGEYELTDALRLLARVSYVRVVSPGGRWWFDIGRPWDLLRANMFFLDYFGSQAGSGAADCEGDYELVPPVFIGPGCKIAPGARVGPYAVLLGNVEIGEGAVISHSILLDGVKVGPESVIEYSIIGARARIGPRAQLMARWANGGSVWMRVRGKLVDSRHETLGAVIGDGAVVEPDTVVAPGIIVMPGCRASGYVIDDVLGKNEA